MASYAASLLDELMGRHRNANPDDKPKESHWSDPEVIPGIGSMGNSHLFHRQGHNYSVLPTRLILVQRWEAGIRLVAVYCN